MRWLTISLISIALAIGSSCKDNPVEELPSAVPVEIVLSADHSSILVGGEASWIYAHVLGEGGDTLGAGFEIRFEITEAPAASGPESPSFDHFDYPDSILLEVTVVTDDNGRALARLYSGTEAGNVTIRATYTDDDEVFAEQSLVTILAVPPGWIYLTHEGDPLIVGGPPIPVHASIDDIYGNPIGEDYGIRFEITDGPDWSGEESPSFEFPATDDSSQREISIMTDENGEASVFIYPGTLQGMFLLRAAVSSDTNITAAIPMQIQPISQIDSISLSISDQTISVGYEATNIYATALDYNDNPLSSGYEIRLDIIESPSGVSFHTPQGDILSTVDTTGVNGRLSVQMFSGTVFGTVKIRATDLLDTTTFSESTLVTIESGPPYHIELFPSNGPAVDGEVIITGIAAVVWDQFINPVEPFTSVHFGIIPDTIAYIEGSAYTGGWVDPETGDTIGVRGMTETWMAYSCYHTFDTVRIIASSGDVTDTSAAIILPIYDPQLNISAQPESLIIQSPDTIAYAGLEARLFDGIGCPIHNGVINFNAEVCGEISGAFSDTTDDQGYAHSEFMIRADEIPENPPDPPQCTAIVSATLRGYPEIEAECEIYCYVLE
ncbi:MAG: hypothetical protein GY839_03010 [candidate division Zixibacteria bacterium]|nr:hypothetical protein [candidate division Zixibacteria bacterium]